MEVKMCSLGKQPREQRLERPPAPLLAQATIEWESQEDGVVAKLLVPEGAQGVAVGSPVMVLVEDKVGGRALCCIMIKKGFILLKVMEAGFRGWRAWWAPR